MRISKTMPFADVSGINGGQAVIAYVRSLDVQSVDDAAARVTERGGMAVLPKMAVPPAGWLVC